MSLQDIRHPALLYFYESQTAVMNQYTFINLKVEVQRLL